MSHLPGKKRPYQDHLRYKHMVARLEGRPFYEIESAVLAEIAKGKRWRIDAALEVLSKNPDRFNYVDYSALFASAGRYGRLTAMQRLVDIYKSEKMAPDSGYGRSPGILEAFDMAVMHGHYRVADFLKQYGASPQYMLRNNRHQRAMSLAIKYDDVKKFNYLIHAGASASYYLSHAVNEGNIAMVARLVDAGADVNLKAEGHWTPLHLAARRGDVSMVELLVYLGADAKLCSSDMLYDLIGGERFAVFERMIALGVKPDQRDLEHAVAEGKLQHVQLMLSKGLQLQPEMLVHTMAHRTSNPEMMAFCLGNGVDPQASYDWLVRNADAYRHSASGTRERLLSNLQALAANGNQAPVAKKPPKHG